MTPAQLIDRIANELIADGRYQRRVLSSAVFNSQFDAVLTGPHDSGRLVTLLSLTADRIADALSTLHGLTAFLKLADSRRPFVLIAVMQATSPADVLALRAFVTEAGKLCRVVEIPSDKISRSTNSIELRQWLRPLLPIDLPQPVASRKTPAQRLLDAVLDSKKLSGDSLTSKLLRAAATTSKDVETTMTQAITAIAQAACEVPHD